MMRLKERYKGNKKYQIIPNTYKYMALNNNLVSNLALLIHSSMEWNHLFYLQTWTKVVIDLIFRLSNKEKKHFNVE